MRYWQCFLTGAKEALNSGLDVELNDDHMCHCSGSSSRNTMFWPRAILGFEEQLSAYSNNRWEWFLEQLHDGCQSLCGDKLTGVLRIHLSCV
jgi:hypothetical protein